MNNHLVSCLFVESMQEMTLFEISVHNLSILFPADIPENILKSLQNITRLLTIKTALELDIKC